MIQTPMPGFGEKGRKGIGRTAKAWPSQKPEEKVEEKMIQTPIPGFGEKGRKGIGRTAKAWSSQKPEEKVEEKRSAAKQIQCNRIFSKKRVVKEPARGEAVIIEGKSSLEKELEADWRIYHFIDTRLRNMQRSKARTMPPMIYRMAVLPRIEKARKLLESQQPKTLDKTFRKSSILIEEELTADGRKLLLEREKLLDLKGDYDTRNEMVEYSMCQTFKERKHWVATAAFLLQHRDRLDFAKGHLGKKEPDKFHHLTDEEI